jgi:hypothetical protein
MKEISRKLFILYIFLLGVISLSAQLDSIVEDLPPDMEAELDDIAVEEVTWSDCFIELDSFSLVDLDFDVKTKKYRDDPTYNYEKDPEKESGLISKLWYKFRRWLADFFGFSLPPYTGKIFQYLIIGLGAFLLIRFLLQAELGGFLRKKEVMVEEIDSELVDADMSEDDLSKLIEKAEQQGAYRLAIRFRYLRILRKLDDAKHILWKPGKTNTSYLNEIKESSIKNSFMESTKVYEYIWYGEYDISDVNDYNEQLRIFQQIEEQL